MEVLEIIETKRAQKDKIVYAVMGKIEDVKEIHFRRAKSENDRIITKDCIPPQLYDRYIAIANKATERRKLDSKLKTQLRWGVKDIEIFVKEKGTEEPLKKVDST